MMRGEFVRYLSLTIISCTLLSATVFAEDICQTALIQLNAKSEIYREDIKRVLSELVSTQDVESLRHLHKQLNDGPNEFPSPLPGTMQRTEFAKALNVFKKLVDDEKITLKQFKRVFVGVLESRLGNLVKAKKKRKIVRKKRETLPTIFIKMPGLMGGAFVPGKQQFIEVMEGREVYVRDLKSGERNKLTTLLFKPESIVRSSDGEHLLIITKESMMGEVSTLHIVSIDLKNLKMRQLNHAENYHEIHTSAAYSNDSSKVAIMVRLKDAEASTLLIWDLKTGKAVSKRLFAWGQPPSEKHLRVSDAITFTPEDRFIAVGRIPNGVLLYDLSDLAEPVAQFKLPDEGPALFTRLNWIGFSKDGKIQAMNNQTRIESFEWGVNKVEALLPGYEKRHVSKPWFAVSADKKRVFIQNRDRSLSVWDSVEAKEIGKINPVNTLASMDLSRNGNRAFYTTDVNQLMVWDLTTGKHEVAEGVEIDNGLGEIHESENSDWFFFNSLNPTGLLFNRKVFLEGNIE